MTPRQNDREVIRAITRDSGARTRHMPVLVTGGAGFVGSNVANRLLISGRPVLIFDNLSRPGVQRNLDWLRETHGASASVQVADIRDRVALRKAVQQCARVYHFAAQVAVTTSLEDPTEDFEINALGTINLMEAVRTSTHQPPVLFTSTNKVYGGLEDVPVRRRGRRYEPIDASIRNHGVGEQRSLDFHSPYGCSKGAADQYVLDYARSFGLRTVVFRMSCIYGPRQFGTEDQGWLAHFLIRAMDGQPISLFGDGHQVRDVLFVEDLVDAMEMAMEQVDDLSGRAFNIGGGPENTTSLLEVVELVAELCGERPTVTFHDWRTGDQRYYVSDTRAFQAATGWAPQVGLQAGLERLHRWLEEAREVVGQANGRRLMAVPVAAAGANGEEGFA